MTKKALLNAYRASTIELEELRMLQKQTSANRPDLHSEASLPDSCTYTNPYSSGLMALLKRKEDEHAVLQEQVDTLLSEVHDFRTYLVLHHYYRLGRTDEQIARTMSISRGRVNQLRLEYLESRNE